MQKVQPLAHLASHALDYTNRDAMVVVALDDGEQIAAKHLEYHTNVTTMRAYVIEAVQQLHCTTVRVNISPARVRMNRVA